jgi:hypothetical protein
LQSFGNRGIEKKHEKKGPKGSSAGLKAVWAFSIPFAISNQANHRKLAKEGAGQPFEGYHRIISVFIYWR